MANKRDYYEVLSVTRETSTDEITKVYRKLAMQYHPDRNPGDDEAAATFREISEAYEVLRDPEKRQLYDQFGHDGLRGVQMPDFEHMDLSGLLGDLLGSFFGGGGGGRRGGGPRPGRDVEVAVQIELEESAVGVTKTVSVPRAEDCEPCQGSGVGEGGERKTCQTCGGQGRVARSMGGFMRVEQDCPSCRGKGSTISKPCKSCRGHGKVLVEKELEVDIPAGVDNGMTRVVRGAGEIGDLGAPPGDLHVVIQVQKHRFFERHNDDLVCRMPITFSQAALGAEIEIPTIMGTLIKQQIPKGTQSHEVLTVKREGMPNVHSQRRGNLLVQVVVETPKTLTDRQKELLRELAELDEVNVSPDRKSWFETVKNFFRDKSKKS